MRVLSNLASLLLLLAAGSCLAQPVFQSAKPIWPSERETEKNLLVGFRAVLVSQQPARMVLRVTASSIYRAFLNGEFLGYGPARAAHGYYRVDEWDLTEKAQPGKNLIAIEVAGYNINSYYLLNQPSFLQAEVVSGSKVLASTSGEGTRFEASILKERVQKVQRYTTQRTFTEVYRLKPQYDEWRKDPGAPFQPAPCSVQTDRKLLPRRVPYPRFVERQPLRLISTGRIKTGIEPSRVWKSRALTSIGPNLEGFKEEELEVNPSLDLQRTAPLTEQRLDRILSGPAKLDLGRDSYQIVDFGTNLTGFLGGRVHCPSKTRLNHYFY
jgi:alpha-L-rhamnosidase